MNRSNIMKDVCYVCGNKRGNKVVKYEFECYLCYSCDWSYDHHGFTTIVELVKYRQEKYERKLANLANKKYKYQMLILYMEQRHEDV